MNSTCALAAAYLAVELVRARKQLRRWRTRARDAESQLSFLLYGGSYVTSTGQPVLNEGGT